MGHSGTPHKGEETYDRYIKKQWQYKKSRFTNLTFMLRNEADADLIYNLTHFDGVRSEWLREVLRKALLEEGRNKYQKPLPENTIETNTERNAETKGKSEGNPNDAIHSLKDIRTMLSLSQQAMADMLNISVVTYAEAEKKRTHLRLEQMKMIQEISHLSDEKMWQLYATGEIS